LLGINSAEVIAEEARSVGLFGDVSILIDAQRSEFYEARYSISDSEILTGPLTIVGAGAIEPNRLVIGPTADGAAKLFPTARSLLRIAATRSNYLPGERLEPIYLRETAFVKAAPSRFTPR
jgi:tRNA A37 threonylcarbamoyladenosine modification protein TsaB